MASLIDAKDFSPIEDAETIMNACKGCLQFCFDKFHVSNEILHIHVSSLTIYEYKFSFSSLTI